MKTYQLLALTIICLILFIDLPIAYQIQNLCIPYQPIHFLEKIFSFGSLSIAWGIFTLIYLFQNKSSTVKQVVLGTCLSFFLCFLITYGMKIAFGRTRPYFALQNQEYGFFFLQTSNTYFSFPSSHAVAIFIIARAIGALWPKYAVIALLVASSIASLRMLSLHHFPSDILVGSFLGYWITEIGIKKNRASEYLLDKLFKTK